MTDFDNTNRGSIWKNDEKTTDKHPDFKGTLNVNGVEYKVAAWKRKEGANPKSPALSFKVEPKQESQSISQRAMPKQNSYAAATGRAPLKPQNIIPDDDMDGDRIPF